MRQTIRRSQPATHGQETKLRGQALLDDPRLNKGTAFCPPKRGDAVGKAVPSSCLSGKPVRVVRTIGTRAAS